MNTTTPCYAYILRMTEKKLIDSKYWTNPNIDKFCYLLSIENVKALKNLARFAKIIIEKFK